MIHRQKGKNAVIFWNVAFVALECPLLVVKRTHSLAAPHASIHSSVLAWRIPGTGKPGGLPSMGSHRVGHDWSDLAAAASSMHLLVNPEFTSILQHSNCYSCYVLRVIKTTVRPPVVIHSEFFKHYCQLNLASRNLVKVSIWLSNTDPLFGKRWIFEPA